MNVVQVMSEKTSASVGSPRSNIFKVVVVLAVCPLIGEDHRIWITVWGCSLNYFLLTYSALVVHQLRFSE